MVKMKITVDTARSLAAKTVYMIKKEQDDINQLCENASDTKYPPFVKLPPDTLMAIFAPKR